MSRAAATGRYEVRLEGHLDDRWSTWFGGLTLRRDADGTTVLRSDAMDQPALHGLLATVRDLGAVLISVRTVDDGS